MVPVPIRDGRIIGGATESRENENKSSYRGVAAISPSCGGSVNLCRSSRIRSWGTLFCPARRRGVGWLHSVRAILDGGDRQSSATRDNAWMWNCVRWSAGAVSTCESARQWQAAAVGTRPIRRGGCEGVPRQADVQRHARHGVPSAEASGLRHAVGAHRVVVAGEGADGGDHGSRETGEPVVPGRRGFQTACWS